MWKKAIKVICVILLIPMLGAALLLGGVYMHGKIMYRWQERTAASILNAHEHELLEIIEENTANAVGGDALKRFLYPDQAEIVTAPRLKQLGFEKLIRSKDAFFFQMPYDGKFGSWVPCGLLYCNDVSVLAPWEKTTLLSKNWYFYWEPCILIGWFN